MPNDSLVSLAEYHALAHDHRGRVAVRLTAAEWKNALSGLPEKSSSHPEPEEFNGYTLIALPGGGGVAIPGKIDPPHHIVNPLCGVHFEQNGNVLCRGKCAKTGDTCNYRVWRYTKLNITRIVCGCGH